MAEVLVLFLLLPALLSVLPVKVSRAPAADLATTARGAVEAGDELLRVGRFESAVAALERAVNLDTSLALAHFRLAVATLWADLPGDQVDSRIAGAQARRDGLDALHRMLLDGFIAWRRGHWHQAEEVYRRALTTYPGSADAQHGLGEALFHYHAPQGRSLDEARVEFERVLEREPRHFGALWHLALIAARDQRVADVDRLTARLLALDPDVVRTLEVEALRAAVREDAGGVDRLIDRLRGADESLLFGLGWRVAVSARNLRAAERIFALMTDPKRGPNAQGIGRTQLFYIQLARGVHDSIRKELRELTGLRHGGAGFELLTLLAAIATGPEVPEALLMAARDSLVAEVAREPFRTAAATDRGRKLATLGAIHAVLGDSIEASAVARRLEADASNAEEHQQHDAQAALIRALIARHAGRHEDVVWWIDRNLVYRWFGHAVFDPFSAYTISRFVRAEALLALGRSTEAEAWFATIGDHDPSDLAVLPLALEYRRRIAAARGDGQEAEHLRAQQEALRTR